MLDVLMVLPSVDGDRAPKETMGIAIVEELRRETAQIRTEFERQGHASDDEEQNAAVERRIADGRRVKGK
jgi:hypothetical protein